jgi:Late competence development protein ComFB
MSLAFESVHNRHESIVFDKILQESARYPQLAGNGDLLADAACVALNALPARYMRFQVDLSFYASQRQEAAEAAAIDAAVQSALTFVLAHVVRGQAS